jgi:hypothetical protein
MGKVIHNVYSIIDRVETDAYNISMDSVSNLNDKFREVDRMMNMFEKKRKRYVWTRKRGRRR